MTAVPTDMIRAGLVELSDASFQRRVWTGRGAVNEMSSFEEAVSQVFDDSGLELELEHGRLIFGERVDADLRALRKLVHRIDALREPDEIIEDPLMGRAREQAAAILDAIGKEGDRDAPR